MKLKLIFPLQARTLTVLLLVSVALNLLWAAVAAGRWAGEAVQTRRGVATMVSVLPAEKRDVVRRELRSVVPALRQHAQAVRVLRAELDTLLAEPQLDDAAIQQQFLKLQQQTTATQAYLQQAFQRAAVNLTPQERRDLLAAIMHRPRRQGRLLAE